MKPNRAAIELRARMRTVLSRAAPLEIVAYRAAQVRYANKTDLISGLGTKAFGGRWTPPGAFATVHASLDVHAALAESLGTQSHYGIGAADRLPLVLVALDVSLRRVLDLTRESILVALNLSRQRLVRCRWRAAMDRGQEALTQSVGRVAFEAAALEGMLVPSAQARGGTNLIVFPDRLRKSSVFAIRGVEELPTPPD